MYKPGQSTLVNSTDRGRHFDIRSGVSLYGGFAGDEVLFEERAGLFDQTILDGDVNGDDDPNFANYGDNCYVVAAAANGGTGTVVVDGFTIRGGSRGEVYSFAEQTYIYGAGLSIRAEATVRNCVFVENQSDYWYEHGVGAGVHADVGPVVFEDCEFGNNRTLHRDGADGAYVGGVSASFIGCIFRDGYAGAAALGAYDGANVSVTQCVFESNGSGGVLASQADATITACTFGNNSGTALSVWGSADQAVSVTDCTFTANGALYSGAVCNTGATVNLRDCLFQGNEGGAGGAVYNDGGAVWIEDCQFLQNAAGYTASYPPRRGGAMYTRAGEVTVKDCSFVGNWASPDGIGGAVRVAYDQDHAVRLVNCEFRGNSADFGGAVACYHATPLIAQCVFTGNVAIDGGAFHNAVGSGPVIVNSVMANNTASAHGGGVFNESADDRPGIHNCILWANQDQDGDYAESSQVYGGVPELRYSCVRAGPAPWAGSATSVTTR